MDITYCFEQCSIGKAAYEKFLAAHSSVFDAAADFQYFTESCFKTCPYIGERLNNKDKES